MYHFWWHYVSLIIPLSQKSYCRAYNYYSLSHKFINHCWRFLMRWCEFSKAIFSELIESGFWLYCVAVFFLCVTMFFTHENAMVSPFRHVTMMTFRDTQKTHRKRMENGGEMDWHLTKPAFFGGCRTGPQKKLAYFQDVIDDEYSPSFRGFQLLNIFLWDPNTKKRWDLSSSHNAPVGKFGAGYVAQTFWRYWGITG